MPFAASCPHCQKQYQLPDQLAGKAVKCKECRRDFVAGQAATAVASTTGTLISRPASKVAVAGASGAGDLSRFGLDGPIVRGSTDIFADAPQPPRSGDALGNFASENPGFADPSAPGKSSQKGSPTFAPSAKAAAAASQPKLPFDNPHAAAAANLRKPPKPKTADIQREFQRLDGAAQSQKSMWLAFIAGISIPLLLLLVGAIILISNDLEIYRDRPKLGLPDHFFYILLGLQIISFIISLVNSVLLFVSIYKLATNLYPGTKANLLHLFLTLFVPAGILFSMITLDRAARRQLRAAGYQVGLLGVKSTPESS